MEKGVPHRVTEGKFFLFENEKCESTAATEQPPPLQETLTPPVVPVQETAGPSSESAAGSSQDIFRSPKTPAPAMPRRSVSSGVGCLRCTFGNQKYRSGFFHCAKQGCKGMAHYDCLGFPCSGVNDTLLSTITWHCDILLGLGRENVIVESTETDFGGTSTPPKVSGGREGTQRGRFTARGVGSAATHVWGRGRLKNFN